MATVQVGKIQADRFPERKRSLENRRVGVKGRGVVDRSFFNDELIGKQEEKKQLCAAREGKFRNYEKSGWKWNLLVEISLTVECWVEFMWRCQPQELGNEVCPSQHWKCLGFTF